MLKKPLVIAMLAAYASGSGVYANTKNQSAELDNIIVSATKTAREIAKTPVSAEVITQADIEKMGAKTLKDVFLNLPGVFINPKADKISIRGVGGKGTLLLIDGRRIGGEYSNVYENNRISANSIERIEIVKGPAGALYGSSALGGVINIITKKPENGFEGSMAASTGANTSGYGRITQVDGDVRGRSGKTSYSAWFSAQKAGSYTENEVAQIKVPRGLTSDENSSTELSAQQKQQLKQQKVSPSDSNLRIREDNTVGGGPGSQPIGNLINDTTNLKTTYQAPAEIVNMGGQITHDINNNLSVKVSASYLKETRELDTIGGAAISNYVTNTATDARLPVFDLPINQKLDNERVEIGIGADYQASETVAINWQSSLSHYKKDDLITSPIYEQLGYVTKKQGASLNGTGESIMTNHQLNSTWTPSEVHRILVGAEYVEDKRKAAFFSSDGSTVTKTLKTASAFAQHEWQVTEPLSLVYGLRYDDHNKGDDAVTVNAGGVYQISPLANLRMRYAQGFRTADSQELFMNRVMPNGKQLLGVEVVDNRFPAKQAFELDEERSENYEIGLQGQGSDWEYDIALFQNRITDSILFDNSKLGSQGYRTFRNSSKVDISGLELSLTKQINEDLKVDFNASLQNTKDHDTDERLEYTPNQQYHIAVDYKLLPNLSTSLIAKYVGDQIYFDKEYKTADAYKFVNLRANYSPDSIKNMDIFAGVDNAFDSEVDSVLGSTVGRYVYAGARLFF